MDQALNVMIKRNIIKVTIGGRGAPGIDGGAATDHNGLQNLDGGGGGEFYHFTLAQHTKLVAGVLADILRNAETSGLTDTEETHAPVGDGTTTIDPTKPAQFIDLTALTDANALTVEVGAGTPAGRGRYGITLEVKTGGASVPAITWPASFKTTPTVDTINKVYLIGIQTRDDGATWRVVEDGGSDA